MVSKRIGSLILCITNLRYLLRKERSQLEIGIWESLAYRQYLRERERGRKRGKRERERERKLDDIT